MKGFALLAAMVITYGVALLPSNSLAEEAEAQKAVLITGATSGIGRYAADHRIEGSYCEY